MWVALKTSGKVREGTGVDGDSRWGELALRALCGALGGLVCGGIVGGFISVAVGSMAEAVDDSLAGLGAAAIVFPFSALFASAGSAASGTYGSVSGVPLRAFFAGIVSGILALLYPMTRLWLYDDGARPYSALLLGAGVIVGPALAGGCAAWAVHANGGRPLLAQREYGQPGRSSTGG